MKKITYITLLSLGVGLLSCTGSQLSRKPTDEVNVFIGTGGHGHTFPGATLPHGMVQLSPDTRLKGWDACAGYHYSDSSIIGFSHTHLSGTGIGDCGDILFMPVAGEVPLQAGSKENPDEGYRSRFSHENESARPGYYQVLLSDDSIHVELTSTLRAGFHRYTYPSAENAALIIDMEPTIYYNPHPVTRISVVNDSTIMGLKYTQGWAKHHYVYFYAVFSSPFHYKLYSAKGYQPDSTSVTSDITKAVLAFRNVPQNGQVMVKVGISAVDEAGAKGNVMAEIPTWNFDGAVNGADSIWNDKLRKIEIETENEEMRTIFYSSLYHTFVQPSLASDIDGRYRTMNHEINRDTSYTNYTVFSLWDTYRAAHPLYTLVSPGQNQAFIRALLRKYDESGLLPKWELASNETGTMIGYHAVSVLADAMMKGQCDFDVEKALDASIRSSLYDTTHITSWMDRSILHAKVMPLAMKYKNEQKYIPCDKEGRSVAQGLEFAYNDWLIAQMAEKLGRKDIHEKYLQLSQAYREYFDPKTKFMRGRLSNGDWAEPFDPVLVERPGNYVEGNAWQWSWFVPHDMDGLIALMGGKEAFTARLDTLFTMSSKLAGDPKHTLDVTGMIGQYAHGNEPSHHVPYLYAYAGQPRKTQVLVDYILRSLYRNDPDGLPGNEDVGQMSAWYVLSAMGFYPVCPGKPVYTLGRPLFEKVTIHLENGRKFVIGAEDNSSENKYIHSMTLNGKQLDSYELSHADLMNGGELRLKMVSVE